MAEQIETEYKQYATPNRLDLMKAIMSPERIIGVLIYAVLRGELNNEVMELARSLPKEYYNSLNENEDDGGQWDMVGYFVHTKPPLPLSERSLYYSQDMLRSEIAGMASWIANGRPAPEEVYLKSLQNERAAEGAEDE
jgi:hypothetical protein